MEFFTPAVIIAVLVTSDIFVMLFALIGWWLYWRERKSHAAMSEAWMEIVKDLRLTLERVAAKLAQSQP